MKISNLNKKKMFSLRHLVSKKRGRKNINDTNERRKKKMSNANLGSKELN